MAFKPFTSYPVGSKVSAAIVTNATTLINAGSAVIFAGASVNTAGSAWQAEVYNGTPTLGGILMGTFTANALGLIPSPLIACPKGLYIVTSGTTPGSLNVFYY